MPMTIWAIADLHLCLGAPDKSMEVFGSMWENYMERIEANWKQKIAPQDLVLIAGDISWAMRMDQARKDLEWIGALPGTKVMIRGNHDLWWSSANKVRYALPPSMHIISNDIFEWEGVTIGGARLWDTNEYACGERKEPVSDDDEKIYARELGRLEMSLMSMKGDVRLAMTHYPPVGFEMKETSVSKLLKKYGVSDCIFGHLHALDPTKKYFGEADGISYHLTAADYLNCEPKKIL